MHQSVLFKHCQCLPALNLIPALVIPAAYHSSTGDPDGVCTFLIYICYLHFVPISYKIFVLVARLLKKRSINHLQRHGTPSPHRLYCVPVLPGTPVSHTPETNGNLPDFAQLKSHNYLFVPAHESEEVEDAKMSTISAASA